MKRIYSGLVENRSGVLCKVAGLFSRRCFNIESLAVGETDDHAVSCMTIVSSGDERTLEQIEKQLNKKLDVIKVKTLSQEQCYTRELMLLDVYKRQEMMGLIGMGNNPMVGATVAVAVSIEEAAKAGKF